MWNIANTLMLSTAVNVSAGLEYLVRYEANYPQFQFELIRVKTLHADWLPVELRG
jgi:hypothetical protein